MFKKEKIEFAKALSEKLKGASSVVLVNYSGMNVKAQQSLKKSLKENSAQMLVVKNTLLKIAGKSAGIDEKAIDEGVLVGQNALVISSGDPYAVLSVLDKFAKENQTPKLRVGVIEGTFQDEASLSKLATLPGKDVLMGQLLGSLMSNLYGLTGVLSGNLSKLIYVLDSKAKQN